MLAKTAARTKINYRRPTVEDGSELHNLIAQCPPLDANSMYCNIVQCTHFSQTAALAESEGQIIGSVTGFRDPNTPEVWFIWQIAVHKDYRGQNLTQKLINHVLERPSNKDIRFIETTITSSNKASWAVFIKLAEQLLAPIAQSPFFDRQQHFDDKHPSESLVRIGPLFDPSENRADLTAVRPLSKDS